MHDAPPLVHRVTHRSVAEEDTDTTRDAPPLKKSITRPVIHAQDIFQKKPKPFLKEEIYQPAFTSASKDYLDGGGLTRAQSIFPQQKKPKSFVKEEIHQPHPLQQSQHAADPEIAQAVKDIEKFIFQEMGVIHQRIETLNSEVAQQRNKPMSLDPPKPTDKPLETRHQQRHDVGTSEERFRRATEALQHATAQKASGAPESPSGPSTPSDNGHNRRPSRRLPSKKPKRPSHDNDRGRAPTSPPSPSSPSSGSDSDHSDRPRRPDRSRRPTSSPIRDKEILRILDNIEK
ncbi:hypothetical protein E4U30_005811, partial [Claviceps sp. LM220 group G6]